ncbi:MAG: TAXI family TRAP transporter solute-binding subunit, partial [Geminicoccales bacterium]
MMLNNVIKAAVVGCLVGFATAAAAEPVALRFATVGIGSSWYNYGAGIADLVKPKLPEGSSIDVLPIAGGVGNMKLIQNGETEFAIGFSTTSAEACKGFGNFDQKLDKIRGVLGGLDTYYFGTFVRKSSSAKSWQDIVDAKDGFKLLTAKVGGTGESTVRQVLALADSSKEAIAGKGGSVLAMARTATASAIADGKADGWAHVVTRGHPAATQLTTVSEMRVLPLPDDIIEGMVTKNGFSRATLPAGTFKGQDEPVKTVKTSSNIMVRADVPEDIVYTFTKTVFENIDKVKKIHAALSDFDAKNAVAPELVGNCPFHPGAVRYYKA